MNTDALAEWEFWENLSDEDRAINTEGVPPYDVVDVGQRVRAGMLGLNTTDGAILDLGCGTGRLTVEVAAHLPWHQFIAVDISQKMLDITEERVAERGLKNVTTRLCDGRTLPLRAERLSAAYAVTVFQHIPHDATVGYIRQIGKALRSGSLFAFTVAYGEDEAFLLRQAPNAAAVKRWCADTDVKVAVTNHDRVRDWTWVTAVKWSP